MMDQPAEKASLEGLLDQIVPALRQRYTRAAHRGRLDQIEQLLGSVRGLVDELPAEEEREAELEERLLEHYRNGNWKSTHPDHGVTHTADAAERLADALERGKAG